MNQILMRYGGIALVAAVMGFSGATMIKNSAEKPQVDRGPDITISDVVVNPTFTSASIYWTTNIPTNGKIEYGLTTSYGQERNIDETNPWPFAYHHITLYPYLSSLGDTLHFRIIATDPKTQKVVKSVDYVVNLYNKSTEAECKTVVKVPEDYRHIQAAIGAACINGTVMVSPGTYREEINMYNGVNLIGASPSNTKIISPAAAGPTILMTVDRNATQGYWPPSNVAVKAPTISGFTISSDYLDMSAPPPPVFERGPIALGGSDNIYKAGSSFGSIGLMTEEEAREYKPAPQGNMTIKNNIFSHNDTGVITGVMSVIENNTFVGEKGSDYGIVTGTWDDFSRTSVIQNNVVVGQGLSGIHIICGYISYVDQCKDWLQRGFLRYNNAWQNRHNYYFETWVWRGGPNMPFSPYAFGAYFSPLWQQTSFLHGKEADQTGKNGNISTDPLFANSNAGDFHERIGSPHVDAGNPQSDFSLELQPNGGRINIGAYGNTAEATKSR